jgi:hypothetical protein
MEINDLHELAIDPDRLKAGPLAILQARLSPLTSDPKFQ